MCGFVVLLNDNNFNTQTLLNSIAHRGPDSSKTISVNNWKFGFNRLGIVGGKDFDQPYSEDKNLNVLVFNGEIYNFRNLAKKYLPDLNNVISDTQVLYNLLMVYGVEIIKKLDGIFSFIFVNTVSDKCILSRDTFGVKPLYYAKKGSSLYFSSEIKPLATIINQSFSSNGLLEHFSFGSPLDNRTIYKEIYSFESGSYEILGKNTKSISKKNFKFHASSNNNKSIEEILKETIEMQTPEIPFGVLYSGGIDSSLILNQTHKNHNMKLALSVNVDQEDMSELYWQKHGLEKIQYSKKVKTFDQNKNSFSLENLEQIISKVDLPITHPNFLGALMLAKEAKSFGLKVLLSGEGADEIFMGYKWFIERKFNNLDALNYVPIDLVSKALNHSKVPSYNYINKLSKKNFFTQYYLRKWLLRADITGMAHSVEVRVPFLGSNIVKAAELISDGEMTNFDSITKHPLKKIAENKFGKKFTYRKKIGFDYPLNEWVGEEYVDYLLNNCNLFCRDSIKSICDMRNNHFYYPRLIFLLTAFTIWVNNK